jgi:hypothetical protein
MKLARYSWALLLCVAVARGPALRAQDNTFHLNVLAYQWTTTHKAITFSWPGSANTNCSGNANINGNVSSSGNIYANETSSTNCSTAYTPPSNQTIDIQKPVVFILADSDTSRMILTCTRNVRWSQCNALNPGQFVARLDKGHLEVQALFGKGKEEWVKYDVVEQMAIPKPTQTPSTVTAQESHPSIEAPETQTTAASFEFPKRWKSMVSGTIRTLRFEGDYIYGEVALPEAAVNAGAFSLMEVKKDGDKYVGKISARFVRSDGGASCSVSNPIELTLVTKDRIEGRGFSLPPDAKIDWNSCQFSAAATWHDFSWIPVK